MNNVRIPPVKDVETCMRIYCDKLYLTAKDVKALFGVSDATAYKLKKLVDEQYIKDDKIKYSSMTVETEYAFRVWGIDIQAVKRKLEIKRKLFET